MATVDLVFLWHMHQPDYRDHAGSGQPEFVLPWVYLHAIKDYTDMAAHLERHPQVRAVINFVPVLVEQIEDYVRQFDCGIFRDPLLRLLATPEHGSLSEADRELLLEACFRANYATMLAPFPAYQRLHDTYTALAESGDYAVALRYLSDSFFLDLVTWYHLAWSGESERRDEPLLSELLAQGSSFSVADRHALLAWIGRVLRNLMPRYQALAERGQIELCCTPQTHPLSPLLLDLRAGRETQPAAAVPEAAVYPGGASRVRRHISAAIASHRERFGQAPVGMWPAEGAISTPFVRILASQGVRWIASGEGVLHNSLNHYQLHTDAHPAWHPWAMAGAPELAMFFRDERLSDMIGFEYSKWHSGEAAQHFVGELSHIATHTPPGEQRVVAVILDGENAWEHYPYNGWYFFEELYTQLTRHAAVRTTTFADVLKTLPPALPTLPGVVAGSWVYGTLSTWVGDAAKNRAWDLLCAAKHRYDEVMASGSLSEAEAEAAEIQLAICESSDWFWWFGDYNPGPAVASFDRLYRRNLSNLYQCLKLQAPVTLEIPLSAGSSENNAEGGGTMRRAS